jgi:acyl carrier protein
MNDRHQTIKDQLVEFINNELIDADANIDVAATDDLLRADILDSLGVMRLVNFIHDHLHIDVPAEDVTLNNFRNVATISDYLNERHAS